MNIQSEYSKKTFAKNISAITLGITLLITPSLSFAQEATASQTSQKQTVQAEKQQVINLNKSTFEQLVSLKGVGHTKAQAIIVYRQQAGGFKSIDELTKVSGIGKKIVSDNRTRLSI